MNCFLFLNNINMNFCSLKCKKETDQSSFHYGWDIKDFIKTCLKQKNGFESKFKDSEGKTIVHKFSKARSFPVFLSRVRALNYNVVDVDVFKKSYW